MQLIKGIFIFVCILFCFFQEAHSRRHPRRRSHSDNRHDTAAHSLDYIVLTGEDTNEGNQQDKNRHGVPAGSYGFRTDESNRQPENDDGYFQELKEPVVEANILVDYNLIEVHTREHVEEYIEYLIAKASDILKVNGRRNSGYAISVAIQNIHLLSAKESNDIKNSLYVVDTICAFRVKNARKTGTLSDVTLYVTATKHDSSDEPSVPSGGVMCSKKKSCGMIVDEGTSTPYAIAKVLRELLGLYEISSGISTSCYEPNEQPTKKFVEISNTYTQEQCGLHKLGQTIRGFSCLTDRPDNAITNRHPNLGERYGVNKQCAIRFGTVYSANIENQSQLRNICTRLICEHTSDHTEKSTTAFDGTYCGYNKWCQQNACVAKRNIQPVNGGWGAWGSWSECSKTCGTSITTRYRRCNNPEPSNGGRPCNPDKASQYHMCRRRACPTGPQINDYRTERCHSKHGMLPFQPVQDRLSCYLFCQPTPCGSNHKTFFEYVKDGEQCSYNDPHSFCLQGKCVKRGCGYDNRRKLVEDKCGVCDGDGSTCTLFSTTISLGTSGIPQPLTEETNRDEWQHLHTLPVGARSIVITESKEHKYLTSQTQIGIQTPTGENVINTMSCKNTISKSNNRMVHDGIVWELKVRDHVDEIKSTGPTTTAAIILATVIPDSSSTITISYLKPLSGP